MENTISLNSLKANAWKSYAFATLFIAGNLLLPRLCHLIPYGGQVLLPIFFFTLIAAYKYGYLIGLLTALASPIVNHVLFGMPGTDMLPVILIKSVLLSTAASYVASQAKQITIQNLLIIIIFYQELGTLAEWGLNSSLTTAINNLFMSTPGMLIQLIGGYFCLKAMK